MRALQHVVPEKVARDQSRWELDRRIEWAIDNGGATMASIAKHLGVSLTSISYRYHRMKRRRDRNVPEPIVLYLRSSGVALRDELTRIHKRNLTCDD